MSGSSHIPQQLPQWLKRQSNQVSDGREERDEVEKRRALEEKEDREDSLDRESPDPTPERTDS